MVLSWFPVGASATVFVNFLDPSSLECFVDASLKLGLAHTALHVLRFLACGGCVLDHYEETTAHSPETVGVCKAELRRRLQRLVPVNGSSLGPDWDFHAEAERILAERSSSSHMGDPAHVGGRGTLRQDPLGALDDWPPPSGVPETVFFGTSSLAGDAGGRAPSLTYLLRIFCHGVYVSVV